MKKLYLLILIITASLIANAQCSVGFQFVTSPSGNVDFVATATVSDSSAYPINYTWSFGDGSSGTGASLTHFYNNASGMYEVCVTMNTANSCTSTFCDSVVFNSVNPCQAGFSFYLDSITVPPISPYVFNDQSIHGALDSISSWNWNFGDGTTSTVQNPVHTFTFPGNYNVCLTINTIGGCSSSFCNSLTISLPFHPIAGPDQSVCSKWAYICATPTVGTTGQWSSVSGIEFYDAENGTLTPSNQFTPCTWIRYPSENDTVTMIWTEFDGVYSGYDSLNIYFASIQAAITLVAPADSLVCGPTYTLLNALQPAFGSGYWYDVIPNTIFSPSSSNLSPTITILPTNYGYHTFFWVTVNGICIDTSTAVVVNFIETPVLNAGGNYWPELFGANSHIKTDTVCGLSYQMSAVPLSGNGHWYSLDSANTHFGNISGPNITSIPTDSVYLGCTGCYSVFNFGQKYKEFIWQENINGCVSTDTLRIYFAPNPSGQFTIEQPICSQNSFIMVANTWPLPGHTDYCVTDFNWSYPNGVMDSLIVNPNVSDTVLISWPAGNQNNVTLSTINTWGCSSPLISHLLNAPFFASLYTNSPTTIGGNNGYIETNVTGGTPPYAYTWSTGQTTANIYNLSSGVYTLNIIDANSCNLSYTTLLYEPYDTTGGPIVDTLTTGIVDSCLNFVPDSFYIANVVIDSINNIATITWTFTNGGLTSSITAQYTYYYSGNNAVILTLNCGVKTMVTYMSYVNITASVGITNNIVKKLEISVYPVPFNDRLNIVFNSKKSGNINLNVIDVTGRSLMMKQISVGSGNNTIELNTSDFHSGIYILNIESDGKVFYKQLVK